jgi:hypothetical protein
MPSSALQARDPRARKECSGTGKRWEIRKLSAGADVSVESSVHPREQRRVPRSTIQGMGSTELKCAALLVRTAFTLTLHFTKTTQENGRKEEFF